MIIPHGVQYLQINNIARTARCNLEKHTDRLNNRRLHVNTVTGTSHVCRTTEDKCNPLRLSSPFFRLVMISSS